METNNGNKPEKTRSEIYKRRVRMISAVAFLVLIIAATVACIPLINDLRSEQGLEQMKERLESYGGLAGGLIFTLIQALQVVIAVVPPIQILGGVLFGWVLGAVLSTLGVFIGAAAVFFIVDKLGRPLVEAFVDEKLFRKFSFLQDERKLVAILMLLYIVPGIPKDVITYLVPMTKVKKKDFFLFVLPCRIPAIVLSTVFGSNVKSGNYVTAIVIVAVFVAMAVAGFFLREPLLARLNRRRHKDAPEQGEDKE